MQFCCADCSIGFQADFCCCSVLYAGWGTELNAARHIELQSPLTNKPTHFRCWQHQHQGEKGILWTLKDIVAKTLKHLLFYNPKKKKTFWKYKKTEGVLFDTTIGSNLLNCSSTCRATVLLLLSKPAGVSVIRTESNRNANRHRSCSVTDQLFYSGLLISALLPKQLSSKLDIVLNRRWHLH